MECTWEKANTLLFMHLATKAGFDHWHHRILYLQTYVLLQNYNTMFRKFTKKRDLKPSKGPVFGKRLRKSWRFHQCCRYRWLSWLGQPSSWLDSVRIYRRSKLTIFGLILQKAIQHTFDAKYDQELRQQMAQYKSQMEQYKQQISMVGYKMTKYLYA